MTDCAVHVLATPVTDGALLRVEYMLETVDVGCREHIDMNNMCSQDQNGSRMYLGITHVGIVTFQGNRKKQILRW